MNMDERRQAIAALEPLMDLLHGGDFWELEYHAVKLCKRLELEFQSDISTVNGLLLAALVNHLKYELRQDERQIVRPM
jgi:hypothetical protein